MGSIFRTADAAGVSNIILTGYTPTPLDRFGRERKDFIKVSLGAEETVRWEHRKNPYAAIKALKLEGYHLAAVEQDARAVSLFDFKPGAKPLALVLGNEVREYAKAQNFDIVLMDGVIYATPAVNITDAVLAVLQTRAGKPAGAAPTGAVTPKPPAKP